MTGTFNNWDKQIPMHRSGVRRVVLRRQFLGGRRKETNSSAGVARRPRGVESAEMEPRRHRSGNDFTYIHNLKKGKHAFKFVVDDEWRFAPDQPTAPRGVSVDGRLFLTAFCRSRTSRAGSTTSST